MTRLSERLKKYFVRKDNKVVFKGNLSLNQLAILIWEELDYQGMDASVLSRVLKGERLFTTAQLEAFGRLLHLDKKEREELTYSLYLDNILRYNIPLAPSSVVTHDTVDFIDSLLNKAEDYRLKGKNNDQEELSEMTKAYIEKILPSIKKSSLRKKLLNQFGQSLCLQSHALGGVGLPKTILSEAINNINQLRMLSNEIKDQRFESYAYLFLGVAYYISGNYSYNHKARALYLHSIIQAKKAYESLPDSDPAKLFALRNMVACSIYLQDKEEFLSLKKHILFSLPLIPTSHFLNGVNLFNLVAQGEAIFRSGDPLKIKELAHKHFRTTLEGRSIHEVSQTRSELETILALKTNDKSYFKSKVIKALKISEDENYQRHYKSIKILSRKLFQEVP